MLTSQAAPSNARVLLQYYLSGTRTYHIFHHKVLRVQRSTEGCRQSLMEGLSPNNPQIGMGSPGAIKTLAGMTETPNNGSYYPCLPQDQLNTKACKAAQGDQAHFKGGRCRDDRLFCKTSFNRDDPGFLASELRSRTEKNAFEQSIRHAVSLSSQEQFKPCQR